MAQSTINNNHTSMTNEDCFRVSAIFVDDILPQKTAYLQSYYGGASFRLIVKHLKHGGISFSFYDRN